jgi:hypothetical protein
MKTMSVKLNLILMIIGWVLSSIVLGFAGLLLSSGGYRDREFGMLLMPIAIIPSLLTGIVFLRAVYKLWKQIQPGGKARTTPDIAVAFLFIPFFNLYWCFNCFWGLSKDYNNFIHDNKIDAKRVSQGIALTMCILFFTTMIPFVGILIFFVNTILVMIFTTQVIKGHNSIVTQQTV